MSCPEKTAERKMSILNINKVEVNVSEETVKKTTDYIKKIWSGMPVWLRVLLCMTIAAGAIYYLYNKFDTAAQVDELRDEIKELNEKCYETVFLESYAFDVNNFVIVARAIDKEVQNIYEINQQILEMEDEYISRNRPGDPSLYTIKRLKQQNSFAKESFDNVIQYNLKMYEEWLEKVKSNQLRSIDDGMSRTDAGQERPERSKDK